MANSGGNTPTKGKKILKWTETEELVALRCYIQSPGNWPLIVATMKENIHLLPNECHLFYKEQTHNVIRRRMSSRINGLKNDIYKDNDEFSEEKRELIAAIKKVECKYSKDVLPSTSKQGQKITKRKIFTVSSTCKATTKTVSRVCVKAGAENLACQDQFEPPALVINEKKSIVDVDNDISDEEPLPDLQVVHPIKTERKDEDDPRKEIIILDSSDENEKPKKKKVESTKEVLKKWSDMLDKIEPLIDRIKDKIESD